VRGYNSGFKHGRARNINPSGSPAREQGDFVISETKQACLGFGGELGGFVQIHRAARHLHRKDVFF
jgi:hypothetical protein